MNISVAQFKPKVRDKEYNLQRITQFLKEGSKQNTDVVIFPEMALTGYLLDDNMDDYAETLQGESIQSIREACKRHSVDAVVSFPEKTEEFNYISTAYIDRNGDILSSYRKTHLFHEEKQYFSKGDRYSVFPTSYGKVGMMICYDLEFPEVSRILRAKGADIILIATANMTPYEEYQDVYVRSRAMENEIPVAICNQVGTGEDFEFFGNSTVADVEGKFLLETGSQEGLFTATLPDHPKRDHRLDYLNNIHPGIYRELDKYLNRT